MAIDFHPRRPTLFRPGGRAPSLFEPSSLIMPEQAAPPADPGALPADTAQPKNGGFFAPGGVGRAIAGHVGDALMNMGGMQGVYAPAMRAAQAAEREEQQYQRRRGDAIEDRTAGAQPVGLQPPDAAIAELRGDPSGAAEFDEIYGPGASWRYLNGLGGGFGGGFR